MRVPVTVRADAKASPSEAFSIISPIDLASVFKSLGPLPAVTGVRDQTGAWDHVGASRTVELSDGSTARERLTLHQPPDRFGYHLEPTGMLSRLVSHAEGEWVFTADGAGSTHIAWTYTFISRSGLGPVVRVLLAPLWRAYASRALARCVEAVERRG